MQINNRVEAKTKNSFSIPEIIASLGGIIYLIQAIIYSRLQLPNLDEGAYLFKGYQFAIGNYQPFQPFGFWTNKMYLSFFVWGWIQKLFSPGLFAPRLFAILLSSLFLAGTWLVTRRMGNRWIAAVAVFALALNPTLISIYSLANSQILVICMLTWVLVFTLGPNRPTLQIVTGAFLSALMVFTRENMVFVFPLLLVYIFWQHGKKNGFYALGVITLTLIVGHLLYWPEITYIWARWIPNILAKANNGLTSNTTIELNQVTNLTRFHSLSVALRNFFVPLLGTFAVLLLWPQKKQWQSKDHLRASVFLLATFLILLISHAWASLGNNYCVYCSTTYFAFFGSLGLILFATCCSSLNQYPHLLQRITALISIPILISMIWFSWFEQIGINLIDILVPRFRFGKILPGSVALWQLLQNKFGIQLETSRRIIPAIFGLILGILLLLICYFIYRRFAKQIKLNFVFFYFITMIFCGIILSPLIAWLPQETFCSVNVPEMYQDIGKKLDTEIPAGSKIYLDGRLSAIPLLYLHDAAFYPPQINGQFSLESGKNSAGLVEKGKWNEEIANQWRSEANYFIIGSDRIQFWRELRANLKIMDISTDANSESCPNASRLYFFQRK